MNTEARDQKSEVGPRATDDFHRSKQRVRRSVPAGNSLFLGDLRCLLLSACVPQLAVFCFLLSAFSFCAQAQFAIDWSTIDGGGGTSTGGVFAVTGTIGQPDAGTMSGGNFTVQGGFWGVIAAVQAPGAPLLSIFRTTTNTVAVTWPSPSTGWTLQQNTNSVSSLNWSNVISGIQDNGTTKSFIVNPPTGNRFYRVRPQP